MVHVCGRGVVSGGLERALETTQDRVREDERTHLVHHIDCDEPMVEELWRVVGVVVVYPES